MCLIGLPKGTERESKGLKTYLKNNDAKLAKAGEGNRHTSPGSAENPKQNEPKEDHTKTHHN